METNIDNVKIQGICCVVPERKFDNLEQCEKLSSKRTKRQVLLTGIQERHICGYGQRASDLCSVAAEELIDRIGWDKNEIKVLVFVTQTPDLDTPSTAMIIQKRLNIGQQCLCFDVNLGCSGYVAGLQIVSSLLSSSGGKGLLLTGDGSYIESFESIEANDMLFGDCGSATAIEVDNRDSFEGNVLKCSMNTDGGRYNYIYKPKGGRAVMRGNEVLLFSLNEVTHGIKNFVKHNDINTDNIDFFAFHQAQKLIIDGIANEVGIEENKILNSYDKFGNTQSSSIPLSICNNIERFKDISYINLFMCGFGVGLSWGNVYIPIETKGIYSVIYSDKYYNDLD